MPHALDSQLHFELILAKKVAYIPSKLALMSVAIEKESTEYCALTFSLNAHLIKFRSGKITPTKPGHFVTVWKREDGITKPHDNLDPFDFFIISVRDEVGFGQFIFHKSVLLKNGVISSNHKAGKRGIRVYAPWVKTTSKQAQKTQSWQCKHFIQFDSTAPKAYPELIYMININSG